LAYKYLAYKYLADKYLADKYLAYKCPFWLINVWLINIWLIISHLADKFKNVSATEHLQPGFKKGRTRFEQQFEAVQRR
jgi:hypothetical protein